MLVQFMKQHLPSAFEKEFPGQGGVLCVKISNSPDGVHFNESGAAVQAEQVAAAISGEI